jgi:hypothetical protein
VNVYGLSHHLERGRARELGLTNEVNGGLGLRYRLPRDGYGWIFDAGFFRDSARNSALLAGAGAYLSVTEGFRAGAALVLFQSDTYNSGDAFIAPIPSVAYEWRALSANLAYSPKVGGVNEVNTFLLAHLLAQVGDGALTPSGTEP